MGNNPDPVCDSRPQAVPSVTSTSNKRSRAQSPSRSTAAPLPKRPKLITKEQFRQEKKQRQKEKKEKILQVKMAKFADDLVLYQDLKASIAEREALPEPVPLTDLERKAVVDLTVALRKAIVPKAEIDLGEKDWVSLLLRYRDAHQQLGVIVDFHESTGPQSQWMCNCTIKSSVVDRRFPDLDIGFIPMGQDGGLRQPTFARKKDAKRYAAKCAIDFLMREKLMPLDGENVSFPKPKVPQPQSKKRKQLNSGSATPSTGSPGTKVVVGGGPSTPAEIARTGGQSLHGENPQAGAGERSELGNGGGAPLDVRDEDFSATDRVLEMCNRLGICPPTYQIVQADQATASFFNGFADFGLDNIHVPDTVGRVSNCFGRKFTKEKVAEEVLQHLLNIEAQRIAAVDDLMSQMTSREIAVE
ncbi:hypothetical protein QBC37DRAFT_369519 [Rhypophila decipiens]|uniref:Uncharacterized protein n=1 Tax=Rhypophila decipiens TaxID=261697 RepID=A0AAN6YET6_9PEZI|nr:hypothetical protein QBC37DRAFT_369519 [Rhypophila decipiens]